MIKVINGDLFNSTARFIVHQVNCQGKMGSGVALQVKQKFFLPQMYIHKKIPKKRAFSLVKKAPAAFNRGRKKSPGSARDQ